MCLAYRAYDRARKSGLALTARNYRGTFASREKGESLGGRNAASFVLAVPAGTGRVSEARVRYLAHARMNIQVSTRANYIYIYL